MAGKNILVIAPHSDDAEIGMGGYLHRCARDYTRVVVIAGGAYHSTRSDTDVTLADRRQEGLRAADILGVDDYDYIEAAQDSMFDQTPQATLVQKIESVVYEREWDQMFIPLPSFHDDHRLTYDAAISATRPHLGRVLPREMLAYEYPGQAWGPAPPDTGRVYCALTLGNMNAKLDAVAHHKSQWASSPCSLYGERGISALGDLLVDDHARAQAERPHDGMQRRKVEIEEPVAAPETSKRVIEDLGGDIAVPPFLAAEHLPPVLDGLARGGRIEGDLLEGLVLGIARDRQSPPVIEQLHAVLVSAIVHLHPGADHQHISRSNLVPVPRPREKRRLVAGDAQGHGQARLALRAGRLACTMS